MPTRPGHGQNSAQKDRQDGKDGEDREDNDPRDPRTFERLYREYAPRLYTYIAYRVGAVQESEDLVADTFMKAVRHIKSGNVVWQCEDSFAAWLFRIAHTTVSDYFRNRRGEDESLPIESLPDLVDSEMLPEDVLLQKEQLAQMRGLIATLSPRRQEVLTLRFFGELQNREIAKVLELDERTVASHLCRGLEDLHRKYSEELARHGESAI
jgi:RNA polymerase sigma-70 factor (ECF subfamily)